MRSIWVSRLEIVEETHRCTDEDGEARNGNCWLRLKLEESNEHGNCDSTATNACHCAEGHNKAEYEDTNPFKWFLRENFLVLALAIFADKVRIIGTVSVNGATVIFIITQKSMVVNQLRIGNCRNCVCLRLFKDLMRARHGDEED